jgi:trehalose-6-phosphatase
MPLPKETKLAQAKRLLRRFEEEDADLSTRVSGLSTEAQEMAFELHRRAIEEQRRLVQRLESDLDTQ